ncbi:PhoH family protein [Ravibacter arvi]|uniref:PhoH-like protein n=1 Tax=Ravibacter arvi TaxID=2051041 RepID=A0ABP8LQB3_9BACT
MLEKIISLEDIPLVDFLGVQNANIKEISSAFPQSKLISRGNEIRVRGAEPEISRISEILESLIAHFHKYGRITPTQIKSYMLEGPNALETEVLIDKNIILIGNKGLVIKAQTANQIKMLEAAGKFDLIFATGPAGTGKTYTAVALAVQALRNKAVKKIIITRPAVEAGENLGFLPGDLKEKIDPYLRPIYDALDDMIPADKLKQYLEARTIEIAPLAYMRGRTLKSAFILLDEAQNTTSMQMKMFLTRMGPDSKVIITGDRTQVDLPKNQKSGLIDALHILSKVKGIAFIELDSSDVVRHKLVKSILAAYEKSED